MSYSCGPYYGWRSPRHTSTRGLVFCLTRFYLDLFGTLFMFYFRFRGSELWVFPYRAKHNFTTREKDLLQQYGNVTGGFSFIFQRVCEGGGISFYFLYCLSLSFRFEGGDLPSEVVTIEPVEVRSEG